MGVKHNIRTYLRIVKTILIIYFVPTPDDKKSI